ncbi:hypothetical protein E2562_024993 [Oryza meyeriana var. granulata]|uniref:Uncharacterized protein n=1 Tax=Oryza meyeriana var. granulata TaxID=110450 RepID=A0A6G1FBW0_9ORYZ|nr:hypothetical protein E2562_024993 [Oryza meyeriana var. granulata]
MRIRRAASRVLGSSYFTAQGQVEAPPPPPASELPPPPTPAAAYAVVVGSGGPAVAPEGVCQLSLSPWNLPYEVDGSGSQVSFRPHLSMLCLRYSTVVYSRLAVRRLRASRLSRCLSSTFRASFVFSCKEDDTIEMKDKIWNHEDEDVKNQKPANNPKKDGAAFPKMVKKRIKEQSLKWLL